MKVASTRSRASTKAARSSANVSKSLALTRLAGAAEAAAVMSDHAIAALQQKHHLVFPGVRRQRIAMAEDNGRASAPVLEIDDGSVLRGECIEGQSAAGEMAVASVSCSLCICMTSIPFGGYVDK